MPLHLDDWIFEWRDVLRISPPSIPPHLFTVFYLSSWLRRVEIFPKWFLSSRVCIISILLLSRVITTKLTLFVFIILFIVKIVILVQFFSPFIAMLIRVVALTNFWCIRSTFTFSIVLTILRIFLACFMRLYILPILTPNVIIFIESSKSLLSRSWTIITSLIPRLLFLIILRFSLFSSISIFIVTFLLLPVLVDFTVVFPLVSFLCWLHIDVVKDWWIIVNDDLVYLKFMLVKSRRAKKIRIENQAQVDITNMNKRFVL